jgi:hypothetical protein
MERRGIGELIGSGRSLRNRGVQKINLRLQVRTPVVVHHDVECRKVKKSEKDSRNGMKCVWNEIKPWRLFIGWWRTKCHIFRIFLDFLEL